MLKREISVRQAILETLNDIFPGGRSVDNIRKHADLDEIAADTGEIMREARFLQAAGYVEDVQPGRDPYFKLTYKGMKQIQKIDLPDVVVWGEKAL